MPERTDTRGFVFAAIGARQRVQARRAARALQRVHPKIDIDLFTDVPPEDSVFAQEHRLLAEARSPIAEALRRSRFDRTVIFAPETIVLIRIDPLFRALDHAEVLAAPRLQKRGADAQSATPAPVSVPRMSSSVLALRRTERTDAALAEWVARLDQLDGVAAEEHLTETLTSGAVRFLPLGLEYNLQFPRLIDYWNEKQSAPRILSVPALRRAEGGDPTQPARPRDVLGPRRAKRLRALLTLARLREGRGAGPAEELRRTARDTLRATSRWSATHAEAQRRAGSAQLAPARADGLGRHTDPELAPFVAAVLALAAGGETLHLCSVGGRTHAAEAPVAHLLADGLGLDLRVTLVEPVPLRRRALAGRLNGCREVRILDAAIGVGPETLLHVVKRPTIAASVAEGTLRGPAKRRARDLATPHLYRARQLARTLFAEAPVPRAHLRALTLPSARLAPILADAGRPVRVDVLLVGRDGVGRAALRACQLGRTRPALVLCDVEDLSAEHKAAIESLLRERYNVSRVGAHLLAVRRGRADVPA